MSSSPSPLKRFSIHSSGFSIALVLMLLLGLLSGWSVYHLAESSHWVNHTQKVLEKLESLMGKINELESRGRGFLLTKDPSFLAAFTKNIAEVHSISHTLETLISDNPIQQRHFKELDPMVKKRIAWTDDLYKTYLQKGLPAALPKVQRNNTLSEQIRKLVNSMKIEELGLIQARQTHMEEQALLTMVLVSVGTLFALGLILRSFALNQKTYQQALQANQDLAESKALTQQFLESIPLGVYVFGVDGKSYFINSTAQKMLGFTTLPTATREQISELSQTYRAGTNLVYPIEEAPITRAFKGEVCEIDDLELHKPEGVLPLQVWAAPIRNAQGKIQFAIATCSDITQRKQYEASLKQAKQAADSANKAKSLFLANMSHELRTPLNAVIGYSEMLAEEAAGMSWQAGVADLQKIGQSGQDLLGLINQILDFSKLETGEIDIWPESFDLNEMIQALSVLIQPLLAQNKNQFEAKLSPQLDEMYSDQSKVKQILFNLLSNACKFTQAGQIELTVFPEQDQICFQIKDTGIGIAPDYLADLFLDFSQADPSAARKYGGTGLGLALSKRYCDLLQGRIDVKSEQGQGSLFTVYLARSLADV